MNEYEIELSNLLDYIKKFGKSDSSARVSLSRMVKSNILANKNIDNKVFYKLTDEGLYNIQLWNQGIERFFKRYQLRHEKWDNKWTTFTLINFKKSKEENQFILENLRELGYREIDNNVWFSPYFFKDEIKPLVEKKVINYLISRGEIETNIEIDQFLNKIYQINDLKREYKQFVKDIKNMKQKIKENKLHNGDLLPYLFELGWNFYDILTNDPALPCDILNNWVGDKAVMEMKDFRGYLVEEVSKYFQTRNGKRNA